MKLSIQKFAIIKKTTFAESNLSPENNTSTLKITIEFSANNSTTYFSSATLYCTCNGVEQSKTVSHPAGGSVVKTFTFNNIKHKSDGTKTVSWNWSCATGTSVLGTVSASGTRKLTDLHKPPIFNAGAITFTEQNQKVIDAQLSANTYVKNLSQVQVDLDESQVTYYDNATFKKLTIYEELNTIKYLDILTNPATFTPQKKPKWSDLQFGLYDSKNGYTFDEDTAIEFNVLDYSNLTLSGNVKRVGQTSGQVSLSCNGVYFNGIIGNKNQGNLSYIQTQDTQFLDNKKYYIYNNEYVLLVKGNDYNVGDSIEAYFTTVYEVSSVYKPTIQYKFWETGDTEPDWDDVSVQVINVNNVFPSEITISDGTFEINNLYIGSTTEGQQQSGSYYFDYKKSYRLKIKVNDYFTELETQELSITLGIPVWSEYPDHVDFEQITRKKGQIYGETELFDDSGDNGSIVLNETSANFEYIEIFYKTNDDYFSSKKIYMPNGKKVLLDASQISGTYTYVKSGQYTISGTNVTLNSSLSGQARIGNNVATTWNNDSNRIYITRVIGYR